MLPSWRENGSLLPCWHVSCVGAPRKSRSLRGFQRRPKMHSRHGIKKVCHSKRISQLLSSLVLCVGALLSKIKVTWTHKTHAKRSPGFQSFEFNPLTFRTWAQYIFLPLILTHSWGFGRQMRHITPCISQSSPEKKSVYIYGLEYWKIRSLGKGSNLFSAL